MQDSKYLVANERDLRWGLTVSTVGMDSLQAGDPYPTEGHAEGYYFNPAKGRILNEYQILYLTNGGGTFRSTHVNETTIKSGDLFVLFPGEWHTYHPAPDMPWESHWIGFKGRNMDDRVRAGFLSPTKPIFHIGFSEEVISLYREAKAAADEEAPYAQQLLAGIANHLVGLVYSLERRLKLVNNNNHLQTINMVRLLIRDNLDNDVTIQDISRKVGLSYSSLRKLFKEFTGVSPSLYQQDLRLQRAKEMLSSTDLSVKEIAYSLHFESSDYFSTKFKQKTGMSPGQFRKIMR